jgi:hypothetical protein
MLSIKGKEGCKEWNHLYINKQGKILNCSISKQQRMSDLVSVSMISVPLFCSASSKVHIQVPKIHQPLFNFIHTCTGLHLTIRNEMFLFLYIYDIHHWWTNISRVEYRYTKSASWYIDIFALYHDTDQCIPLFLKLFYRVI